MSACLAAVAEICDRSYVFCLLRTFCACDFTCTEYLSRSTDCM